ncbi:MAG: glycosyltransferase family 39 protein [Planctomycetota bacterium]|jgi:4-amino-4-deoxy-L-arabinose transferase-like glycosyltransferase
MPKEAPVSEPESPQNPPPSSSPWKPLLCLLALFLALRLILIANTYAPPVDAVRYFALGSFWTAGNWRAALACEIHPLYPFLLGFGTAPFSDPEIPARILSLFFSTLALIPLYFLALPYGGRRGAFVTLAVFALLPHPLRLSIQILTEPLFLLLLLTLCACALKSMETRKWAWAAAAGFAGGASYLTRPEGALPLLAFGIASLWPGAEAPRFSRRLAGPAIALLSFFLLAGPYMAWIGGVTAKKSVARLAGTREYRHDEGPARPFPQADSPPPPGRPLPPPSVHERGLSAWNFVGENPDHRKREKTLTDVPLRLVNLFGKAGHFVTPFLLLFGFVISRIRQRPAGPDLFFFLLFVFSMALVGVVLTGYRYGSLRHAIPATVMTLPVVGWGVQELWQLAGTWKPRWSRGFLLLWGAAFVIFFLCQGLKPLRYPRRYLRPVGAVLKERTGPSDLILSDDPRFAWMAGRPFLALGILDAASLAREAKAAGVRVLVTDRKELNRRDPDFEGALQTGPWRPLDLGDAGKGTRYEPVAFEWKGAGGGTD